jgi:hypothetical protein
MKTKVDSDLVSEAHTFRLRFSCEHCAHDVPESGRCAEGFPSHPHRVRLELVDSLEFCKSFELA